MTQARTDYRYRIEGGVSRREFMTRSLLTGAAMLTFSGCRSPKGLNDRGVLVPGPGRPNPAGIIDVHMHVGFGVPNLKPGVPETDRLMTAEPPIVAERVVAEMKQAGVGNVFAMGQLDGPTDDPLGLGRSLQVANLVPGMMVIGIADPRRNSRAHLRAVESQIQRERSRLVAFKAFLGYIHAGPDHPGYAPYYKLAAKYQLPFVFHTGDTWSLKAKVGFAHPLGVDAVATDHPDVRFVLAHMGNPWLMDAAEVIEKNDNVWADLSGMYVGDEASLRAELAKSSTTVLAGVVISDLKNALGYAARYDRLLYGTDWPLAPMPAYRAFAEAVIPKEHQEKVFRTNAEQLFFSEHHSSPAR